MPRAQHERPSAITAQIGGVISSGKRVSLALSFGVLEAKDKKVTFTFDSAALSKAGGAQTASRDGGSNVNHCCAADGIKDWDEQSTEGFSTHRLAHHAWPYPFRSDRISILALLFVLSNFALSASSGSL